MWRCSTATRRWPRDQKSKPEVNSRDVIKWRSEACASISVSITDIWTKFGTEHKYCHINTPEWPNSHKLKIQDGGGRHLGFRKMWITPSWIELFAQKLVGKMHHGHAEMRHGQKSKPDLFCVTSLLWRIKMYILNECREHNRCDDVKAYKSSQLTNLYFLDYAELTCSRYWLGY